MTRYTLHVPEFYNDGRPVTVPIFDGIESRLLTIAGGFTLTHGIGAWRGDAGTIYREPVRLYALDTADESAGEELIAFSRTLADLLDQEAIYLTHTELSTALIAV